MVVRITTVLAAVLLITGCQGYQPMPLDLAAYKIAWAGQSLSSGGVVEYARRLRQDVPGMVVKYDPSDGLSLREAEVVALFFNPELRAARITAKVALAGAEQAGRWEDPVFEVEASKILDSVPEPWLTGVSIGFTIPLSGRPGAEKSAAMAEYDSEKTKVRQMEWEHVTCLREKWVQWSAMDEKISLTKKFLSELDAIIKISDKLTKAGELGRIDARVFTIERAKARLELKILVMEKAGQELELKALLGLVPDAKVKLLREMKLIHKKLEPVDQVKALEANNLKLAAKRAVYEVAEKKLYVEICGQYPDLSLGFGPEKEEGDSLFGFSLGFPLPMWNKNARGIAEARSTRLAARAEFRAQYQALISELALSRNLLMEMQLKRTTFENEIAGLVDKQVEEARKLAGLGEFDALLILEVLTSSHEAKIELLDARVEESKAVNKLNSLLGPFSGKPAKGR